MTDKSPESRIAEANARQAEAAAKQAEAAAEQAIAEAGRAQVSALIPDFSKIQNGNITVAGEQAAFGSLLGRMALRNAADKLSEQLPLSRTDHVLLTSEADLVTSDAVYLEVINGLDTLTGSAAELLASLAKESAPAVTGRARALTAAAVAGAIASAAPGLLSLFSADRALSSTALTADSKAAMAAVAAGLKGRARLQIDDFRITQGGQVAAKETLLREERSGLVRRRLEIEEDKQQAIKEKSSAIDEIETLKQQLAGLASSDSSRVDLETTIRNKLQEAESAGVEEHRASVAIQLVGELVKGIDNFLGALHTIPASGKRSPFATAILRQQLRAEADTGTTLPAFTKVLFIEAAAGSVDQLLNDRPLWFEDRLHSIGSVAITYWLLDTATSQIQASGVASGIAEIRGKIGGRLEFVADMTG